jgi:hypothetical protein
MAGDAVSNKKRLTRSQIAAEIRALAAESLVPWFRFAKRLRRLADRVVK